MLSNPVIDTMLNHKSIRKYKETQPTDEVLKTVVRAGQQVPFSFQLCSILLSRNIAKNIFKAPFLFTICVDSHRLEIVMAKRDWKLVTNDLWSW